MAKPIPEGYHTVTPHITVTGADKAIEFYKQAFGAQEIVRMPGPGGQGIMHAEIKIGDSVVMLSDSPVGGEFRDPQALGGSPIGLMIYVPEVDKTFKNAVSLGAKESRPVVNQFYGDRSGTLVDPFGHVWTVATHVEDVSPQQMQERMANMQKSA